jgi:hypothetical protein
MGVFGLTGSTIGGSVKGQPNTASSNGNDGFIVGEDTGPSDNNTFTKNAANLNQRDGIEVLGADSGGRQQASNNRFMMNTMTNNVRFDAEDQSLGGGTGATGDTWGGNVCKPKLDSAPVALCSTPITP